MRPNALDRMREAWIGRATLTHAEVVQAGLGEMRGATAPHLLLKWLRRLLLPSASDARSALLQRVRTGRLDIPAPGSVPRHDAAARRKPARVNRDRCWYPTGLERTHRGRGLVHGPTVRDKMRLRRRTN